MKALSIRQPWCWAILNAGKNIENRDWKRWNPALHFRGPFLIHASKGMSRGEYAGCLDYCQAVSRTRPFPPGLVMPSFDELPRGGVVGRARIVDIVRESTSPWFMGPLGLVLEDVCPLPFVPYKGQLGFFDVPDDILPPEALAA